MAKKPSMGRQKIKLAKIEIKNNLQVTFSKRRTGLFKKASELCTLCGVEIAIIVFSPAGKVFSFGNPNVQSILDRFLDRARSINYPMASLLDAHRVSCVSQLNLKLSQIVNQIEVERERGENMRKINNQINHWWEAPVSELGFHELQKLRDAMQELKESVNHRVQCPTTSYLDMSNVGGFVDQYNEAKSTQPFVNLSAGCFGNNFGFF